MELERTILAVRIAPTKTTGKKMWSIKFGDDNGVEIWAGTFKPEIGKGVESVKTGDAAKVAYTQNGQFYNLDNCTKVHGPTIDNSGTGSEPPEPPLVAPDKNVLITAQSSYQRGIEATELMLKYGGEKTDMGYNEISRLIKENAQSAYDWDWEKVK